MPITFNGNGKTGDIFARLLTKLLPRSLDSKPPIFDVALLRPLNRPPLSLSLSLELLLKPLVNPSERPPDSISAICLLMLLFLVAISFLVSFPPLLLLNTRLLFLFFNFFIFSLSRLVNAIFTSLYYRCCRK